MDKVLKINDRVKDKLTGFSGIVTGRVEYLYNTPDLRVQPEGLKEDGQPQEAVWFTEGRLTKVTQA